MAKNSNTNTKIKAQKAQQKVKAVKSVRSKLSVKEPQEQLLNLFVNALNQMVKNGVSTKELPVYFEKAFKKLKKNKKSIAAIPSYNIIMKTFEHTYVAYVLKLCNENRTEARAIMGLRQRTFFRLLRKVKITPGESNNHSIE